MTTTAVRTTPEQSVPDRKSSSVARSLAPLAVDVAVPVAVYFLARDALGYGIVDSYLLSSVLPVLRTLVDLARTRSLNTVALLMLAINLAGAGLTFVTGSIRLGTAKSAAVSGVVGIAFLVSAVRGRPMLSEAMRPFITRGEAAREGAWHRLHDGLPRFRTLEVRFTAVYGAVILAECALRIALAFTAPVSTLGWLPTVVLVGALAIAVIVSGGVAADPITRLVDAEAGQGCVAGKPEA